MTSSTLLPAWPARYVSDSRAALRPSSTTVTTRRLACARRARASAPRKASRPSSVSRKATPMVFGSSWRSQPCGATATGHGDPDSSRAAVAPASTRPRAPRRLEPTTSRPARRSSAASCSAFAALVPMRTSQSAWMPYGSSSSRISSTCGAQSCSRSGSGCTIAYGSCCGGGTPIGRGPAGAWTDATISGASVTRASTTPRRTGARSFVRGSYPTRIGCPMTRDVGRGAALTREP